MITQIKDIDLVGNNHLDNAECYIRWDAHLVMDGRLEGIQYNIRAINCGGDIMDQEDIKQDYFSLMIMEGVLEGRYMTPGAVLWTVQSDGDPDCVQNPESILIDDKTKHIIVRFG